MELQQLSLFAIAQNSNQCSPPIAKLGYVSCLGSRTIMPLTSISWSRTPLIASLQPPKPAFVVRADSNPQDTAEESEQDAASVNVDQPPDPEAEAEQVSEPKPLRKPRVKLGDIMGVISSFHYVIVVKMMHEL